MEVRLTWEEVARAAWVGVQRHLHALVRGLRDKHCFKGDPWSVHIEGAIGELVLAKATGRYWDAPINTFKEGGDVGKAQVRTRSRPEYDLLIRPDDRDDEPFVLVTGRPPIYQVVGWMWGRDAKRPEWLQTHGDRDPAYFPPKSALQPMTELP